MIKVTRPQVGQEFAQVQTAGMLQMGAAYKNNLNPEPTLFLLLTLIHLPPLFKT